MARLLVEVPSIDTDEEYGKFPGKTLKIQRGRISIDGDENFDSGRTWNAEVVATGDDAVVRREVAQYAGSPGNTGEEFEGLGPIDQGDGRHVRRIVVELRYSGAEYLFDFQPGYRIRVYNESGMKITGAIIKSWDIKPPPR